MLMDVESGRCGSEATDKYLKNITNLSVGHLLYEVDLSLLGVRHLPVVRQRP